MSNVEEELALDWVYDILIGLIDKEDWEAIDTILASTQVDRCSKAMLLSILICTSWVESKLKNRTDFYNRCRTIMSEQMLQGLQPK